MKWSHLSENEMVLVVAINLVMLLLSSRPSRRKKVLIGKRPGASVHTDEHLLGLECLPMA
jgi:hypothetical protein